MQVVKSLNSSELDKPFALTIGNFDGVHKGHRKVLDYVKSKANELGLKLVVVTFNPHPQEILNPGNYFLLNSFPEKCELIKSCGADFLCEIKFDRNFSTLSPENFLKEYIFNNPNLKSIFLGHDFAFGANKSGGHDLAEKFAQKNNVVFEDLAKFTFAGERVSSSLIREKIKTGLISEANDFLGREYFITGRVVKGDGRGKQIGFPTANIGFEKNRVIPSNGVYATKTCISNMNYFSVTNIGVKPTFLDHAGVTIESHILDFDRDIYGEEIQVQFFKRIRDEKKFDSVNSLIKQIEEDVVATREFFE